MSDRAFFDTNIFVYAYSEDDLKKRERALLLIEELVGATSTQVLNELCNVLRKKYHETPSTIRNVLTEIDGTLRIINPFK